jgi:hypothetical protein
MNKYTKHVLILVWTMSIPAAPNNRAVFEFVHGTTNHQPTFIRVRQLHRRMIVTPKKLSTFAKFKGARSILGAGNEPSL